MARLRHVAMTVPHADLAKTARFYEDVFGMRRERELDIAIMLTDGTVSLALVSDQVQKNAGHRGLHHIGFVVDDIYASGRCVLDSGGRLAYETRELDEIAEELRDETGRPKGIEVTFRDPNGVIVDLVDPGFADRNWRIAP